MKRLFLLAGAVLAAAATGAGAAQASSYRNAPAPVGIAAAQPDAAGRVVEGCLRAAAEAQRIPAVVLVLLLDVEDGRLGRVSRNANGTVDIGPMQVNGIWLPELATHWGVSMERAFGGLRDDFCANVEAGAWILRQSLDAAGGDFWGGVGGYHSHHPGYQAAYLRKVLAEARRLQAASRLQVAAPTPSATSAHGPAGSR